MAISDAKELGRRIKQEESMIELEADLGKKVFRIKATGAAAWVVAVGAIGTAIAGFVSTPASGPVGPAVSFLVTPAVATSLGGVGIATVALSIAGVGGVAALNHLYHEYTIKKLENGNYMLNRKK